MVCGLIRYEHPHKIRLQIMKDEKHTDSNPNCDWKWIQLKFDFSSVDEAKLFLNNRADELMKLFTIKTTE